MQSLRAIRIAQLKHAIREKRLTEPEAAKPKVARSFRKCASRWVRKCNKRQGPMLSAEEGLRHFAAYLEWQTVVAEWAKIDREDLV